MDDRIIVIAYARMKPEEAKEHQPTVVVVDEKNNPTNVFNGTIHGQTFGLENGLIENPN